MNTYKERQEKGFEELKEILQEKGENNAIQGYIKRLGEMFEWYVIVDLDWDVFLSKSRELSGEELEKFLRQVVELVEEYDE